MPDCSRRSVLAAIAVTPWLGLPAPASAQDSSSAEAELIEMLQATTAHWNQGNLDGFIAPYADSTAYMTPAGPIGKDAMRARYASRYFTGSRPDQQLRFEQLRVRPLGVDHALMTGRFVLSGGAKADQSGWFTLVWTRTTSGWRIIHDHSS